MKRSAPARNGWGWALRLSVLLGLTFAPTLLTGCDAARKALASRRRAGLPALEVKELTKTEVTPFLDEPGKIRVLMMLRSTGKEGQDRERDVCHKFEEIAADFSDVTVFARADYSDFNSDEFKVIPGVPLMIVKLDGKFLDGQEGNGALNTVTFREVMSRHAEILRKEAASQSSAASGVPTAPAAPPQPEVQPMKKDWLPPGIQKR